MRVETLRKQWDARAAGAPLHRSTTFDGDDLVLGAGTKLATIKLDTQDARKSAVAKEEARLLALLSAAYLRPIEERALKHVRRAIAKRRQGETVIALTHLAMSGLPKLGQPEQSARRLFMADGLMNAGVEPRTILRALELDERLLDELERRYNPDQPRVPPGNGRESGQWTNGSAIGGSKGPSGHRRTVVTPPRRAIQIADNSDGWWRFINPVGEAHAQPPPVEAEPEPEPDREVEESTRNARDAFGRAPLARIHVERVPGEPLELPKGETYLSAPPEREPEDFELTPGEAIARARARQLAIN